MIEEWPEKSLEDTVFSETAYQEMNDWQIGKSLAIEFPLINFKLPLVPCDSLFEGEGISHPCSIDRHVHIGHDALTEKAIR